MRHKIIVSLDGVSVKEALNIASKLKNKVWGFKVNDLLFEPNIIRKLKKFGKVFADAKLYDIPSTVARSVARLKKAGADLITVHASGGVEMMKAALRQAQGKTKILGVTVLTSEKSANKKAFLKLITNVEKAKLDGIVCSAHELKYLNNSKLLKVVPGIRPKWFTMSSSKRHDKRDPSRRALVKANDQSRTTTPREAIKLGADLLVIGRPIIKSPNQPEALEKILSEF